MKPVRPLVTKTDDNVHDSVETHPGYGQISASHVSGRAYLYGSDFDHQHFVSITIARSELHRGLSNDWPHPREELIQVHLSEAQWASFVSRTNYHGGTQCTINHINQVGVPGIAEPVNRVNQFKAEGMENLAEVLKDLSKLAEEIEGNRRKTVMRDIVSSVIAQFSKHSGLAFIAKQFGEHMETVTEKAKIEVNAYITDRVGRAGLKALQSEAPIKLVGYDDGDSKTRP